MKTSSPTGNRLLMSSETETNGWRVLMGGMASASAAHHVVNSYLAVAAELSLAVVEPETIAAVAVLISSASWKKVYGPSAATHADLLSAWRLARLPDAQVTNETVAEQHETEASMGDAAMDTFAAWWFPAADGPLSCTVVLTHVDDGTQDVPVATRLLQAARRSLELADEKALAALDTGARAAVLVDRAERLQDGGVGPALMATAERAAWKKAAEINDEGEDKVTLARAVCALVDADGAAPDALATIKALGDGGLASALHFYGRCAGTGFGMPRNAELASTAFQRASALEHAVAQFEMAPSAADPVQVTDVAARGGIVAAQLSQATALMMPHNGSPPSTDRQRLALAVALQATARCPDIGRVSLARCYLTGIAVPLMKIRARQLNEEAFAIRKQPLAALACAPLLAHAGEIAKGREMLAAVLAWHDPAKHHDLGPILDVVQKHVAALTPPAGGAPAPAPVEKAAPTDGTESLSRCVVCDKMCNPKKCSRCKTVGYCSGACQKTHWPEHKKSCKK